MLFTIRLEDNSSGNIANCKQATGCPLFSTSLGYGAGVIAQHRNHLPNGWGTFDCMNDFRRYDMIHRRAIHQLRIETTKKARLQYQLKVFASIKNLVIQWGCFFITFSHSIMNLFNIYSVDQVDISHRPWDSTYILLDDLIVLRATVRRVMLQNRGVSQPKQPKSGQEKAVRSHELIKHMPSKKALRLAVINTTERNWNKLMVVRLI